MDGMIQTCRFEEFVCELTKTVNQEKEDDVNWQFYLHKVWEGTFKEFLEGIETNKKNQSMSKKTIETTVKDSMNILKGFNPTEGGDC